MLCIYLMMFGSWCIDERKLVLLCVFLMFDNGELNFYVCFVWLIDELLDDVYDWCVDVMNDVWDLKLVWCKLKVLLDVMVCDVFLDQIVFVGVGNIIKNEVLFWIGVYFVFWFGDLLLCRFIVLIEQVCVYSFDFLEWKCCFELKKYWQVYMKKVCFLCGGLISKFYLGMMW